MRRGLQLAVGLAVLGALAWLLFPVRPGSEAPSPTPSRAADSPARSVRQRVRPGVTPASASTEALLDIRGTVLGPRGPSSGARVLASAVVPGDSLSTLPCGSFSDRTLLDCFYGEHLVHIAALVSERRGEAIVRAQSLTGADGSFVLSGLEEGTYAVWVESPEGVAFRPSVAAGAEPVELRLGTGRRLSGTVTDDAKVPVAGALITAIFSSHSRFFETLTDAEGHYQLGPLPPGLVIAVIAKQSLLTAVEPAWTYTPETTRDFVLSRPKTIRGRVLRAKAPVAGVEVHATGDGTETRTALTDAAGRFSFEGLSPVLYSLSVEQAGTGASTTIYLSEGSEDEELTLELKPIVFIEGVVRDEDQNPLADAEISAFWEAGIEGDGEAQESPDLISAATDEAGRYRLGPMPPGWYSLSARAATHQEATEESREYTQQGTTQDFTLKRAWVVEGLLVDAQGLPVEGEGVDLRSLSPASSGDTAQTDSEGRFSLAAAVEGEYELKVDGRRVRAQKLTVTVPSKPLRIVGEALLHIVGEVVDETGTPLPGVEVAIWPEQAAAKDRPLDSDDTNGEGQFSLRVASAGRYVVMAELFSRSFLRAASQTVAVEGGSEARVQLRFDEGHRFSGRVVDWRGHPLPELPVQLQPAPRPVLLRRGDLPDVSVKTDAEGRFSLQQVSGEAFDACIRGEVYSPLAAVHGNARCVRVKNDGQEVRIVVGRDVFVTGRLVYPDGSPVTHYRVNGREIRREDGELSLLIHQPGVERIELSAPGLQPVLRTAPEFPEGVQVQDLGTLVLSP